MSLTLVDAFRGLGLPHLTSEESIVQRSQPFSSLLKAGIYFLVRDQRIVYVGQSVTPSSRIIEHAREGKKEFDNFFVHYCLEEELNLLETLFILYYQPFYNGLPTHLVDNSEYSLISKQGIKRYLVDTPFTLNHFKKWEAAQLILPVVNYKNMVYYWLSDWVQLFATQSTEYHQSQRIVRQGRIPLSTTSTRQVSSSLT